MKLGIVHTFIRTLLAVGRGAFFLGKELTRLFSWIKAQGWIILRLFLPSIFLGYRLLKKIKRFIARFRQPTEERVFYLVANRYFVHILVVLLVFFVSFPSIFAVASGAEQRLAEDDSLLFDIFGDDEELIIDENLETKIFQGSFLSLDVDFPPEAAEEELFYLLQGEAVWSPPLSPSVVKQTRIKPEEYIVAPKDTISSIAARFDISAGTILWENKLGPYDIIRPGQKLTILPVSGVTHAIKKGDTIQKIARLYNVSFENIKEYNENLESLTLGTRLIIPGGKPVRPPAPKIARVPAIPPPASYLGEGPMLWPTPSRRINQYFNWRHPGLDIDGDYTSPLYAADDGIVELVQYKRTGYGYQIVINHGGGIKTRYGHESKIFVKPGEKVSRGQVIGIVGSTGRSTGTHVHFEVIVDGRRANPLGYIR